MRMKKRNKEDKKYEKDDNGKEESTERKKEGKDENEKELKR